MKTQLVAILITTVLAPYGFAQTVAPVQSPARPLGLPVHGPVFEFASDARSADFYYNVMPTFMQIVENHLEETVEFSNVDGFKLDASRLLLRAPADQPIRIYFLSEGAGYHNTVGFNWTEAGASESGPPTVLFPDTSIRSGASEVYVTSTKDLSNVVLEFADRSHQKFEGLSGYTKTFRGTGQNASKDIIGVWIKSGCNSGGGGPGYGERINNPGAGFLVHGANSASGCTPHVTATFVGGRTPQEPLKPGDFVEIGVGERGFQLDFFLIANAVNGGSQWLWNDTRKNPDGLNHLVAFMIQDSRYILLGFEDIVGGGDLDYNDALFVIDIGQENAENLYNEYNSLPH